MRSTLAMIGDATGTALIVWVLAAGQEAAFWQPVGAGFGTVAAWSAPVAVFAFVLTLVVDIWDRRRGL